jgi:hypothetical protein
MNNEFAIALAWPQTFCKQPGSWYDSLMHVLGVSKNHYYQVGHAAVVLINNHGECHYFDFGRYHAPFGFGRVRNAITDHDLAMQTKALIQGNEITNINEILNELYNNKACHGEGDLHASFTTIDFEKSYLKAKQMQQQSPWKYGPFIWKGTNCSRFVRTTILAGMRLSKNHIKLLLPWSISPTPLGNVKTFSKRFVVSENSNQWQTSKI